MSGKNTADGEDILVLATGTANVASVRAALLRLGRRTCSTLDPARVLYAPRLVVPGVGSFAAAMGGLRRRGLDRALRERLNRGRPTLAICLGLQLLGESSEEDPGCPGLSVLPGGSRRFGAGLRVPHMGWNRVRPEPGCRWLEEGQAYFANSYRLDSAPPGWRVAWADYGGRFVAALERRGILACQFHPELSGAYGAALLDRWAGSAGVEDVIPC